jgi:hypothetical protein
MAGAVFTVSGSTLGVLVGGRTSPANGVPEKPVDSNPPAVGASAAEWRAGGRTTSGARVFGGGNGGSFRSAGICGFADPAVASRFFPCTGEESDCTEPA